jgi:hypothetical protein
MIEKTRLSAGPEMSVVYYVDMWPLFVFVLFGS